MSDMIKEIKERGYWEFIIRPVEFEETRIPILHLQNILMRTAVSLRGWDFPHLSNQSPPQIMKDYVQQTTDFHHFRECWMFFQSGQFYYIRGFSEDWRDRSSLYPAHDGWQPNSRLGLFQAVATMTEFFEFAARLAMTKAGGPQLKLSWNAGHLNGRSLFADSSKTFLFRGRTAALEDFGNERIYSREDLASNARVIARQESASLFERFGLAADETLLETLQSDLRL